MKLTSKTRKTLRLKRKRTTRQKVTYTLHLSIKKDIKECTFIRISYPENVAMYICM